MIVCGYVWVYGWLLWVEDWRGELIEVLAKLYF